MTSHFATIPAYCQGMHSKVQGRYSHKVTPTCHQGEVTIVTAERKVLQHEPFETFEAFSALLCIQMQSHADSELCLTS